MPASSDQLNIRCDKDLKAAFIAQAKTRGTTATDLIVDFMRQYLGLESLSDRVPKVSTVVNPVEIEEMIESRLDARLASLRLELLAEVEGKLVA